MTTRYPTMPLFDLVMGVPYPVMDGNAEQAESFPPADTEPDERAEGREG